LPFSVFHRLELHNALCLAIFQRRLTLSQMQAIWANIESDLASGLLVARGGLWHRVFREAETLATLFTPHVGSRTLDIIHVASAHRAGLTEFCTFDPRQAKLAGHAGLFLAST
jgi:predicted nucleic acid-binding protein